MRDLIKRYIMQKQRGSQKGEGVTEDDINELKQDVSSFRFELLEILRNNGMKTPNPNQPKPTSKKLRYWKSLVGHVSMDSVGSSCCSDAEGDTNSVGGGSAKIGGVGGVGAKWKGMLGRNKSVESGRSDTVTSTSSKGEEGGSSSGCKSGTEADKNGKAATFVLGDNVDVAESEGEESTSKGQTFKNIAGGKSLNFKAKNVTIKTISSGEVEIEKRGVNQSSANTGHGNSGATGVKVRKGTKRW